MQSGSHSQSLTSSGLFLVGAERSGTTLLRYMLNSHPRLAWRNEFEYSIDPVSDEGEWPPMDKYYEWLSNHRVFHGAKLPIDHDLDYVRPRIGRMLAIVEDGWITVHARGPPPLAIDLCSAVDSILCQYESENLWIPAELHLLVRSNDSRIDVDVGWRSARAASAADVR